MNGRPKIVTPALIAGIRDRITDGGATRQIARAGGLDDPFSSRRISFAWRTGCRRLPMMCPTTGWSGDLVNTHKLGG